MNMSLRQKIIIILFIFITFITIALGYYSFYTSKTQIIKKVSTTNLAVISVIDNNIERMKRTISDWVTVFSLSSVVQDGLRSTDELTNSLESQLYTGTMSSIMNQMLVTGNFDYMALYGKPSIPLYQVATDDSSGAKAFGEISPSPIYQETLLLNGASLWFPLNHDNNVFIDTNRNEKIGMTRLIRSTLDGNQLGFIFIGVNKDTIRNQYLKNMYDDEHGIVILDKNDSPLLTAGKQFYDTDSAEYTFIKDRRIMSKPDSRVITSNGEELLLSYSQINNEWKILYAVPLSALTKELNSIKFFVYLVIIICLLLSIPVMLILTHFLISPLKNLLMSMRRFQNGNFDEKVEIKYRDEIGQLSRGYNTMVANIKSLVDDVYVLRLKEQEAEWKALQSQINPHFLYNMLDTIFWEAERTGQERISEMVINLSRLFRLSLNRGSSLTTLSKEKELIRLYLTLQHMRFQERLEFKLDIPEELDQHVIIKLILQPFIENALIHGIEKKREGGKVTVSAARQQDMIEFIIVDSGSGMTKDKLEQITQVQARQDFTSIDTDGYAIQNVIQRLQHYYKQNYKLTYHSEPGQGTRVTLLIPASIHLLEESNL
jgi:two-component system sensor histidine kinase YesM